MLDSLYIANFRLFRELKIKRLGMVNLFSGKNGSGKSCLLEALNIYFGNGHQRLLADLIASRNEDKYPNQADYLDLENGLKNNPFRHLFRGRAFPPTSEDGIQIGKADQTNLLQICTRKTIEKNNQIFITSDNEDYIFLMSSREGKFNPISPINQSKNKGQPIYARDGYGYSQKLHHLDSYGFLDKNITARLWDEITLTPLEEHVIQALNFINDQITGLTFSVTTDLEDRRIPAVRIGHSYDRIPLKSLGDGAVRILHIILAMVNAKEGVLLIDEAENGLHWSVHPKLWKIIFHLSQQLNIQVFATTHSKDCIAGFHEAWLENPEEGAFFRLDADPEEGAKVMPYSLKTLGNALKSQVEMR
ncbi:MAG: AAA family ATPase [Magnetococcales bacterium]|nr:AAA family ATPase [Magnetococcales bacterium]